MSDGPLRADDETVTIELSSGDEAEVSFAELMAIPHIRQALAEAAGDEKTDRVSSLTKESDRAVSTAALTLAADKVFSETRRRIGLIFRVRLGIGIILAIVLIGTLAGAVISLFLGRTALAAGLGAATLADLIGTALYKPLDKIRANLVDTQRLDLVNLMAQQQLTECNQHQQLDERINCQQAVWSAALDYLERLETAGR